MSSEATTAGLRAEIIFTEKDRALREDVHRLGELVGELVNEQAGEALFDLVEAARRAAIRRRDGDPESHVELQEIIDALAPSSARDFIRAFSTYFQMVNMAEKVHRIRRRREYLSDPEKTQPYGFADTVTKIHEKNFSIEDLEKCLRKINIEPVFTAHPSEVTRRTLLRKQQNIAKHLIRMLDPYLTPMETEQTLGQIKLEMTTGWQTAEHPTERRLSDEAEHVLFFVTDVLYRMIPPFYEDLERAIEQSFHADDRRIRVPEIVRFSSWIGGDMDGNPTVTAKSIRAMLGRQRSLILNLYYSECRQLGDHLSQSEGRCSFSTELLKRIDEYRGHFSSAAYTLPLRHNRMPYRMFLRLVQARLQATFNDDAFPYESPEELIADIELIADSLRANQGRNAGLFAVKRLLRRIETFRFHLATIDLRQNALVHRRVVGEGLGESSWLSLLAAERSTRIKEAIERRESPLGSLGSEARRTLSVFQSIAHSRRRYGSRSIGIYIVRAVRDVDDMLTVLLLAKWGHLGPKSGQASLDVAPLFETSQELKAAPEVMEHLLNDTEYRAHLEARGNQQYIMLGYAMTAVDGDIASARWNLDSAYRRLAATLSRFGVEMIVFHGPGGPLSRTGGPVHEALNALPRSTHPQYLRMTEHGEMINNRYGLRGIAMRSLEQILSAMMLNTMSDVEHKPKRIWHEIMQSLATSSARAFSTLTHDPDFEAYFRSVTPIDVIERIGIGTTSQSTNLSPVEGVHEAAWSLAWTQTRCILPGWFGFGSGTQEAIETFGIDELVRMHDEWPLLRLLVADIEVSLAKSDLDVTAQYAALADNESQHLFESIRNEYNASVDAVLKLTGQSELLERSATIARSIKLRNPYVDPMSFLQIHLLRTWREAGSETDAMLHALMASVNGIAHAMQDAG